MSHNPYSSPNATIVDSERKGSLPCTIMFWLSCVLSLGMFAIAAISGYQYWVYASQGGVKLPPHILAVTVCVACSGLGMLYSAIRWRRQLIRAASVSFGCSLLAFFVAPKLFRLFI
ncbi:hypothetical protein Pla22_33930 [Rubripirellula amarantea]|uniref:Uncharacterized protein n=1 Tax=Rubripirellula amarantea TaxID=2527999 RepID=A0A5C5WJ38_9BACT|nr:hypothetical protein Pla22_33930 [Rubripirellula amarantea]